MICRNIIFISCIFLAVVIANIYSAPHLSTGSDVHDKVNRLATKNPKSTAENGLGALLDARDNAMVYVAAGDTLLVAHRAVLAARSPVFAAKLQANSSYVSVADMEGRVLRQLLALLYTPEQCQQPAMSRQLLAAAHRFGVSVLKSECSQREAIPLSVETVAATAVVAVRHSCDSLGQAALAFIKAHIAQVMASEGWVNAVYMWHEEAVEVTRMLFHVTGDSSTPATGDRRTSPTTQPPSLHTDHDQTPSTAAPSVTCGASPPPDSAAISALRSLSAKEKAHMLIAAAAQGSVGEVAALLSAGAAVGAVDEGRMTALHWAAAEGHLEVARCLLGAGADVGARDGERKTALNWAADRGHLEVARCLLGAGADAGARNSWHNTPLHHAAWWGYTRIVRLLLAASADPHIRNVDGWTPLHSAAWRGHPEAAAALLEAGADRGVQNNDGETPLDLARGKNNQQMVALLS